ncbi:hypothetical protein LMIY3S_02719 [Labrys miyagiensis]
MALLNRKTMQAPSPVDTSTVLEIMGKLERLHGRYGELKSSTDEGALLAARRALTNAAGKLDAARSRADKERGASVAEVLAEAEAEHLTASEAYSVAVRADAAARAELASLVAEIDRLRNELWAATHAAAAPHVEALEAEVEEAARRFISAHTALHAMTGHGGLPFGLGLPLRNGISLYASGEPLLPEHERIALAIEPAMALFRRTTAAANEAEYARMKAEAAE